MSYLIQYKCRKGVLGRLSDLINRENETFVLAVDGDVETGRAPLLAVYDGDSSKVKVSGGVFEMPVCEAAEFVRGYRNPKGRVRVDFKFYDEGGLFLPSKRIKKLFRSKGLLKVRMRVGSESKPGKHTRSYYADEIYVGEEVVPALSELLLG